MAVNIKVSTEVLKAKADSVSSMAGRVASRWDELERTVTGSKSYWEGKTSDSHQTQIKDISGDAETVIRRLREHPKDLLKMAGIYETTEKEAGSKGNSLPVDVIK